MSEEEKGDCLTDQFIECITKAPSPITPLRGSYVIPQRIYPLSATESDYARCIIEGYIKVRDFIALACDISPLHPQQHCPQFEADLADTSKQIGLICYKVKKAITYKSIKVRGEYFYTSMLLDEDVSLVEAIKWLEKQDGIKISSKLSAYANHMMQPIISEKPNVPNSKEEKDEWIYKLVQSQIDRGKTVELSCINVAEDNEVELKKFCNGTANAVKAAYYRAKNILN